MKPNLSMRPLYLQIRDHFVALIASGEWQAGRQIDSEAGLANTLGVSVGTVRKALDTLEAEGLVTRRQGRGTKVNDQTADDASVLYSNLRIGDGQRVSGTVASHVTELVDSNPTEQLHLKIGGGEKIFRCVRVRKFDETPFMHEQLTVPQRLMPDLKPEDFMDPRVTTLGARRNGILIGPAQERVSIELASAEVAEALGIAVGKPLLRLERTIFSITSKPLEWRVAVCDLHEKYYMADIT